MNTIEIRVENHRHARILHVPIQRMYNFGSATRNPDTAVPHQQEVAKEGIHIAFNVPAPRIYPIAPHALTTGDAVFVHGDHTSGEVEIAILVADQIYVGVASDHTDRDLERVSIPWSKQACPNVLAPIMWPLDVVRHRWDDCVLRSRVDGRPYQEVGAAAFLHPEDVLRTLHDRVASVPARDYLVLCGTIVSLDKALGFGKIWEFELDDPQGGKRIRHRYAVNNMFDEIHEEFRVPVRNPARPVA